MSESGTQVTDTNGQSYQLPALALTPQVSQFSQLQGLKSENNLLMSRQEMSVGQLFEAWNYEAQNMDMITFADQKFDKVTINSQVFQDPSLLGKRPFESENQSFQVPEPAMKRHELSVFNRKGLLSNGTEDKEILRTVLRRDSSINEEYDPNMGVDLMDFNQPFCGWTKAA